ncbi:hypothetical protein G3R67_003445 [Salmonella enterica subsp. enterica serovar Agona]|nr:hypothetical protein [Salmonella enterica subsp. enterica serovar Agona]EJW5798198.1 hypothetical protein [Salmonella enterica]
MKLSETDNVYPVTVFTHGSVVSNELRLIGDGCDEGVALDQTTAAELLPILQYFIETGELPE